MQQIPPDWVKRQFSSGFIKFGGSHEWKAGQPKALPMKASFIQCTRDQAEWLGERMAICRIEGGLSEQEADRVTLAQWQDFERRMEGRR